MNPNLNTIQELLQKNKNLSEADKEVLIKAIADADKQWGITDFKLDRTEKVKKTTAILLEETIEELEQKRKAVEAQNRELEIESSLEKVRTVAMGMRKRDDMLDICRTMSPQLESLGIRVIRNVQTAIFYEDKGTYINYEYYRLHDKTFITEVDYTLDEISKEFAAQMTKGANEIFIISLTGKQVEDWFNIQKTTNVFIDTHLEKATSLTYYWFSLGPVALGMSTYQPLNEAEINLFKRFRNVFGLAYQRYIDIEKAESQAREAQIQLALERVRARTMAMQKSDELMETAVVLFDQLKQLGEHIERTIIGLVNEEEHIVDFWATRPGGSQIDKMQKFPLDEPIVMQKVYGAWRQQKKSIVIDLRGEELESYFQFLKARGPRLKRETFRERRVENFVFFSSGWLGIISSDPTKPADVELYERFAAVFDQTYMRFLDLQKAEAQARESQIEAALERVRSRTMAMQKSTELQDAALLLVQQVKALGVPTFACGYNIWDDDRNAATAWMAGEDRLQPPFKTSSSEDVFFHIHEAAQRGETLFVAEQGGEELETHYRYMASIPAFKAVMDKMEEAGLSVPTFQIIHCAFFSQGYLMFISFDPVPEAHDIFKRFAKVFEQTYTRFLDLQKAEAQAREARIEAALEKVRSRSLAMHKSDELNEVVTILFEKIKELQIPVTAVGIGIYIEGSKDLNTYVCGENEDRLVINNYCLPYFHHKIWKDLNNSREKQLDFFSGNYSKEEKNSFYKYVLEHSALRHLPDDIKTLIFESPAYTISMAPVNHSMFMINDFEGKILSENEVDIIKRFARVFDQAYTRFLDLQKAEAQAREAQIEAAVERVRAQSMAMHQTTDLDKVNKEVYNQLQWLKVDGLSGVTIYFFDQDGEVKAWDLSSPGNIGDPSSYTFRFSSKKYPVLGELWQHYKNSQDYFTLDYPLEKLKAVIPEFREIETVIASAFEEAINSGSLTHQWNAFGKISDGVLGIDLMNPPSEDTKTIVLKMAGAFNLAYKRFLDLQKAEAQAREARIEAALEKVRSRSLAMHNSDELREIVAVVFEKLKELDFGIDGAAFIAIPVPDADYINLWIGDDHAKYPSCFKIPFYDDPVIGDIRNAVRLGLDFFSRTYSFEEKNKWFNYAFANTDVKTLPEQLKQWILEQPFLTQSFALGKNSMIGIHFHYQKNLSANEIDILKRFSTVFEQAYVRFLDLQKAEVQALEAIKRASVDRVRAEIASMRTTGDLERIQPLIWNELKTLGVPFIRCGVFIMDEEKQEVQTMLSTPGGKAIATLHVPFEFDLSIITNGVKYWRKKKLYTEHWDAAAFTKVWIKLSSLRETSMDSTQAEHPPESLHLHMLPFLQGMLYVGSEAPLNDEQLQLVQNLADAFSTAYARYEDFNKLEAAKKQVDNTLNELQVTQKQLIQSEKMASLGELTAGIAHEIQNPLNFVNNFSEVSNELIDEMNAEIEKGDMKEAKSISNDIKQNLEKILHHGKRADGIVKGMLQHSRTSSGQKELTDINMLADEYLRLAYHGLRAKDKSFNATLNHDFDKSIGKINLIPQDIGRVFVNLINNAFYAVNEKTKQHIPGYEPAVTIITKKVGDKAELRVIDNGNGIPKKVLDKIFQPFFTTKPTGQGTGLGLSLAYDIITKGHGGELKVETKEGEGTEFIIQLPV